MADWYQIPYLQFRSNSIIQYNQFEGDATRVRDWQGDLTANLLKQKTYSGRMCPGGKKRLTRCVELMLMATKKTIIYNPLKRKHMPFKIGFLTLTIYSPDRMIQGKEAHKLCLEPFLLWLRRKHGVKLYIWKAELQQRGQIHYHLILDTFIHKDDIQAKWNQLQVEAGYLDMDSYFSEFGHTYVPSTKIHSVYRKRNLAGYIGKCITEETNDRFEKAALNVEGEFKARGYQVTEMNSRELRNGTGDPSGLVGEMAKKVQNLLSVGGKVWDCSMNLKSNTYFLTIADNEYLDKLYEMVEANLVKVIVTDNCLIYKLLKTTSDTILSYDHKGEFECKMWDIRNRDTTLIRREQASKREQLVFDAPKKVNVLPIPDLFSSS